MDVQKLRKELTEYVDLISEIRVLSAVRIDGTTGGDEYAEKLRHDYGRIRTLGEKCRGILSETIDPLLRKEDRLSPEEAAALQDFCDMLLNPSSGEELDLFLLFEISERLLLEFEEEGDDNRLAKQLNLHISVCYANVNRTSRVTVSAEICTFYRDSGLAAAEKAKKYLYDREKFLALDNDAKTHILRANRFYSALYDTFFYAEDTNAARYQALLDSIRITETPFYRENVCDYPWELHRCRSIEHMGQLTERGNRWGFKKQQCKEILGWLSELTEQWEKDPEKIGSILPEAHYRLIMARNRYFAGEIEKEDYQETLLALYDRFATDEYDMYAVQCNLLIPSEYLSTLRGERIPARTETTLRKLYDRVINYILHSVNMDAFNFLQEYLTAFLDTFIEIPGVMTFEEMGLYCLAALHPPTYVHSLMVADIARCLAEHLAAEYPESFAREFGLPDGVTALEELPFVTNRIYHSALCHDFGKIAMIDSIFVYGRDLLEREREIIRYHTLVGAEMLGRYSSTKPYADLARTHHVWYSSKGGYPALETGRPGAAAGILEAADSIDAATDSVGRSYRKGKTLEQVSAEIMEGSGMRYAPAVAELLSDPEVNEDLLYLLSEGRRNHYRKVYQLFNGVKERLNK